MLKRGLENLISDCSNLSQIEKVKPFLKRFPLTLTLSKDTNCFYVIY